MRICMESGRLAPTPFRMPSLHAKTIKKNIIPSSSKHLQNPRKLTYLYTKPSIGPSKLTHPQWIAQSAASPLTSDSEDPPPIFPRWTGIVPDVPFTGDDQGSTIYTALANLYGAGKFDESQFEADIYAREAGGSRSIALKSTDIPAADTLSTAEETARALRDSIEPPESGIPHRWQVVGMMALSFVLCNMDKVNMSVAVIPMAKELGWTATERGLVSSSFFWGYSLTQIPAGWVSTSIGGARVLAAGVALWSIGTLIAPPAAKISLLALCATRVFVGLGEGLAPSSATNVMARLVPE